MSAEDDPKRKLISFIIGAQEFCVEITAVREIRGWTPATPVPHAPPFICGVINLRGAVLPIVDMAARLGLPNREPTERNVIIVVWIGGKLVGLLVDAVCDILAVGEDTLQTPPDIAQEPACAFIKALLNVEGRMLCAISLEELLPHAAQAAA